MTWSDDYVQPLQGHAKWGRADGLGFDMEEHAEVA
jgi:hypothetical protein